MPRNFVLPPDDTLKAKLLLLLDEWQRQAVSSFSDMCETSCFRDRTIACNDEEGVELVSMGILCAPKSVRVRLMSALSPSNQALVTQHWNAFLEKHWKDLDCLCLDSDGLEVAWLDEVFDFTCEDFKEFVWLFLTLHQCKEREFSSNPLAGFEVDERQGHGFDLAILDVHRDLFLAMYCPLMYETFQQSNPVRLVEKLDALEHGSQAILVWALKGDVRAEIQPEFVHHSPCRLKAALEVLPQHRFAGARKVFQVREQILKAIFSCLDRNAKINLNRLVKARLLVHVFMRATELQKTGMLMLVDFETRVNMHQVCLNGPRMQHDRIPYLNCLGPATGVNFLTNHEILYAKPFD